MNHSWKKVPIQTIYKGFWDGPHATPKKSETGPIFLGIKNMTEDGHLDFSSIRHIAEKDYPKWTKRVVPQAGDIVFTYEASLHRYAILPQGFRGCLGRRVALIRPDGTVIDTKFLLYYFLSSEWRKEVSKHIILGATVDRIPLIEFPDFEIHLPPLETQRKIAAVLSAYDDLIENNTRRIQILEEMAQAIYRQWFVEFQYPGHEAIPLVDSGTELGEIPQGWEVQKVKEIVKRLSAGTRYKQKTVSEAGQIPVIDQSRSEILGFHNNALDHNASPENPIIIFGDHTCKMQLMVVPFSLGPNVVPFVSKDELPIIYLYFLVNSLVETREYKRHWNELTSKLVAVSGNGLATKYSDIVTPMFEEIELLKAKNANLRATRDLLLPRLVSGAVDVSGVEVA